MAVSAQYLTFGYFLAGLLDRSSHPHTGRYTKVFGRGVDMVKIQYHQIIFTTFYAGVVDEVIEDESF